MKRSVGSGLAGALAVSLLHESMRKVLPQSPRMDLLGMQAISLLLKKGNMTPPSGKNLFYTALAGDIISNTIYYSLAGSRKPQNIWLKGAVLGASAGIGAIMLPKPLGLKEEYSNRSVQTKLLTFGLYLIGGLITAAVSDRLNKQR